MRALLTLSSPAQRTTAPLRPLRRRAAGPTLARNQPSSRRSALHAAHKPQASGKRELGANAAVPRCLPRSAAQPRTLTPAHPARRRSSPWRSARQVRACGAETVQGSLRKQLDHMRAGARVVAGRARGVPRRREQQLNLCRHKRDLQARVSSEAQDGAGNEQRSCCARSPPPTAPSQRAGALPPPRRATARGTRAGRTRHDAEAVWVAAAAGWRRVGWR